MTLKNYSIEVIGLSFHPIGSREQRGESGHQRLVYGHKNFEPEPLIAVHVVQLVDHAKLTLIWKVNAEQCRKKLKSRFPMMVEMGDDFNNLVGL
jgi:hypothetical protein